MIFFYFLFIELDFFSGNIVSFRFFGLSCEGVEVVIEFFMVVTVIGRIDFDKSLWSCEDFMVDFWGCLLEKEDVLECLSRWFGRGCRWKLGLMLLENTGLLFCVRDVVVYVLGILLVELFRSRSLEFCLSLSVVLLFFSFVKDCWVVESRRFSCCMFSGDM